MGNLTSTTCDEGSVELDGAYFRDELLTFPGADTYVAGTLLARRSDALSVTASAVSGGGTGTVSAASVVEGPIVPLVGVYTLTCVTAVVNGGIWKLQDPNGALVADNLQMTAGAGAATIFEVGGLIFTITDGGTDFSAGATATLTVTADGKLVVFDPAGAGGVQRPIAVLTYDVTKAGSGDLPVRVLITGQVKKERLIIDADGSGVNITAAILDALVAQGIIPVGTKQLAVLDN